MHIVQVAPMVAAIDEAAPPLGGAQAVLADLCKGLGAHGHRVTLLAASGSRLSEVRLVDLGISSGNLAPVRFDGSPRTDGEAQRAAFATVRRWLDEQGELLDVVHCHAYDAAAFDALLDLRVPVVHTVHLPPLEPAVVSAARRATATATLAAVSNWAAQAWRRAGVRIDAVIHNGVDLEHVPFGESHRGYLLWAGRIAPEKGADAAVRAARAMGMPLLLAGDIYDPDYYEQVVCPLVREDLDWREGDKVPEGATFVGSRARAAVHGMMAGAAVTLMPVAWDEPFGLVAVEAAAAGSPVVAFRRGGLEEVVVDGKTGILVETDDEAAFLAAAGRALSLDRARCRREVQTRFPLERMIEGYEELYAKSTGAV